MTARSIFQKICPGCMNTLPRDARQCACGHQFDHDDTDAALSSEEIRLKAEELYESYLAARAEQSSSAVMAAQAEFARDPANLKKSDRVASAIREAEEARAALAAHSARVAEMKKALQPATPPPPPVLPGHVATKQKIAGTKPIRAASRVRTAARPVNTVANIATAASVRTARATRTVISKPEKIPSAPVPAARKVIVPPVQTKTPNPAFRQAQAARAEKILRQAETTVAVKAVIKEEIAVAPIIVATPKMEPRIPSPAPAPIPTKSAPRLLGSDKKECPNCTSSVDSKLNRCRCGYEFSTSALIPSLSMSDEERAEFAKLFSLP